MQLDSTRQAFVLHRELPPGKFGFKFLFDGRWSYSASHPTFKVRQDFRAHPAYNQ